MSCLSATVYITFQNSNAHRVWILTGHQAHLLEQRTLSLSLDVYFFILFIYLFWEEVVVVGSMAGERANICFLQRLISQFQVRALRCLRLVFHKGARGRPYVTIKQ